MKAFYRAGCAFALSISLPVTVEAQSVGAPAEPQGQSQGTPSSAQQAADAGIADIVVTAQRRSESLQKTALTIQVLQADTLAKAGVTSPLNLTAVLPSVQVGSSGPAPSVYIRGVGSYASTAGQSPAVPFYTDGVYVARSQGITSEFYDLDRVEVLKGPQGTLYGRNASGGAVNILTKVPSLSEVAGYADVELGNYGDKVFEAAINLPLSTTLAARVSGQIADKGGYTSENFGDDKHQSGRVKVLWQPAPDVRLLMNGSYGHIGGRGPANVVLNRALPGWYPWLDASSPQVQAFINAAPANNLPINPAIGQFGPGAIVPTRPDEGQQSMDFYNASAQLDWTISPSTTLTILPAYRYSRIRFNALFGFLQTNGYAIGDLPATPETSKETTIEVRLTGTYTRFKYIAGAYFYNEDQAQIFNIYSGALQDTGIQAAYGTRSYAAFGQATWEFVNGVRAIGGLRYTSDRRSISNGASFYTSPSILAPTDPCFARLVIEGQAECYSDRYAGTTTFHDVSWKGGVEADLPGGGLAYATVSRGFKAGGFNTQSTFANPGSGSVVGEALPFKPEVLISYEAGIKTRLLDNKLQVNLTGFYWDYKDHQEPRIAFTPNGSINLIYFNAGTAHIYGADLDIVARPWRGMTLNFSGEYAKSKYVDFIYTVPSAFFSAAGTGCKVGVSSGGQTPIDCSGFEVARTPEWTASVGAVQDIPLGSGSLTGDARFSYAASRWLAVDFVPIERAKPYATLDLALTYHLPGDRISVTGFVRNVTNGTVYTFAIAHPLVPIYTSNIGAPRTYGARMSVNF